MAETGYRCRQCRRTFSQLETAVAARGEKARCPTCGSSSLDMVELLEEWGYVSRGSPCFG